MTIDPVEPEGLEPKPEPTAIDKYNSWLEGSEDQPPVDSNREAATSGGEKEEGGDPAKPTEATTEQPQPRKLKYKAHGEEREATEEEAAQALAAHADYMKNIQAVKNREAELEAHRTLLDAIQKTPAAQKALREVFDGQQRPQDAPKPPDDPIDRLAWDIEQKVLEKVNQRIAPLQKGQQAVTSAVQAQSILSTLHVKDELFNEVYHVGIPTYLQTLPPGTAKLEAERLQRDPEAFLEVYGYMRDLVQKQHDAATNAAPKTETTNQQTAQTAKERVQGEAAKRIAPALESSGPAEAGDSDARAKNAKEQAGILARIRRGEAKPGDSLRLMELKAQRG